MTGPITGAITSVKAGRVHGWVDNADPNRALALFVGRRRVASANPLTGIGRTRSDFAFDARGCPPYLLAAPELVIHVTILGEPTTRIAAATIATEDFLKLADLPAASDTAAFEGCIDESTPSRVRGWARDASRPERQLDLLLFAGDRFLGKYMASAARPDLARTGRGHGNYGFEIPLPDVTGPLTIVVGDPEFWRLPLGAHAVASSRGAPRQGRDQPGALESFARALASADPFPKKAFVIDKVKRGAVPDAFSADYVVLALECLRHEMVAKGEAMPGTWRGRLRTWAEMRVLGLRMRRLEELAAAIVEGPRLLAAAAERRARKDG